MGVYLHNYQIRHWQYDGIFLASLEHELLDQVVTVGLLDLGLWRQLGAATGVTLVAFIGKNCTANVSGETLVPKKYFTSFIL